MRIAYLCTDFGIPIGGTKGASIHVRELCRAWRAEGHEVRVYSPRPGSSDDLAAGPDLQPCPPSAAERRLHERLRQDDSAGAAAAGACRALRYTAALPGRLEGVLHAYRPQVLYERYSLFGSAGAELAARLGLPHLLEVNAPLAAEQRRHRGLGEPWASVAAAMERELLLSADRVIAVSRPLGDWIEGLGVPPARLRVLPNGVDPERFAPSPEQGAAARRRLGIDEAPLVGFVGSLKPWHDVPTLLRALALLRAGRAGGPAAGAQARLLIVGDGPGRAELEATARALGLREAVLFTGAVPHEEVPALLAALDVAVAPCPAATRDPLNEDEGPRDYFSPLKLFEYLAAGRPVVATDGAPSRQAIEHGRTGWLTPAGDAGALARALAAVLEDPVAALRVAREGRRRVLRRHSWRETARRAIALGDEARNETAAAGRRAAARAPEAA